ncbi:hypothetical protein TSUD_136300 [Trifolium subterraneum]|uniref:DCD domain-containing protein n=1 Tax=Trifolium subterraneum TaxID=3900 RepID=A0A2Z6NR37_TRISU|nr:hypothetical protein TSUD_136300 [Trifolium subterraneum]
MTHMLQVLEEVILIQQLGRIRSAPVQVITRKICEPLEEDSFRPILHHYDGPKFRLELSVSEALSLLDIFADQNSFNDIFKAIPA